MLEDRGGGWFVVVLGKVEAMGGNGILVVFISVGEGCIFGPRGFNGVDQQS